MNLASDGHRSRSAQQHKRIDGLDGRRGVGGKQIDQPWIDWVRSRTFSEEELELAGQRQLPCPHPPLSLRRRRWRSEAQKEGSFWSVCVIMLASSQDHKT